MASIWDDFDKPAPTGGRGSIWDDYKTEQPRSVLRTLGDYALDLGKGAIVLGEGAVGLTNLMTHGVLAKGMDRVGYDPERAKQFLSDYYSDQRKESEAEVAASKGFIGRAGALIDNPDVLVGRIVESLPQMGAAAGVARKIAVDAFNVAAANVLARTGNAAAASQAGASAVAGMSKSLAYAASGAEGALTAGNIAETIRRENPDDPLAKYWAVPAGIATALIGGIMGKLGGNVESAIATSRLGGAMPGLTGGLIARAAKGGAAESVEEAIQSGQETAFTNVGLGKPVGEGVAESMAEGGLVGAATGAGFGAASRRRPEEPRAPESEEEFPFGGYLPPPTYEAGATIPDDPETIRQEMAAREAAEQVYREREQEAERLRRFMRAPDAPSAIAAAEEIAFSPIEAQIARDEGAITALEDQQRTRALQQSDPGIDFTPTPIPAGPSTTTPQPVDGGIPFEPVRQPSTPVNPGVERAYRLREREEAQQKARDLGRLADTAQETRVAEQDERVARDTAVASAAGVGLTETPPASPMAAAISSAGITPQQFPSQPVSPEARAISDIGRHLTDQGARDLSDQKLQLVAKAGTKDIAAVAKRELTLRTKLRETKEMDPRDQRLAARLFSGKKLSEGGRVRAIRLGLGMPQPDGTWRLTQRAYQLRKKLRDNVSWGVADGGVPRETDPQTRTPEFQRWFGESKVRDERGEPLVVYRGTTKSHSVINTTRGGYFTKDPDYAAVYTNDLTPAQSGDEPNVMPVYLSIQNPRVIKNPGFMELARAGFNRVSARPAEADSAMYLTPEKIAEYEAQGYDGIINEPRDEIIVFRPEQIKSATGNRGTFDPNDPNILKQDGAPLDVAHIDIAIEPGESEDKSVLPRTTSVPRELTGLRRGGVRRADPAQASMLAKAVNDASGASSVARRALKNIRAFAVHGARYMPNPADPEGKDIPTGHYATYYPSLKVISVREDLLERARTERAVRQQLVGIFVHEAYHEEDAEVYQEEDMPAGQENEVFYRGRSEAHPDFAIRLTDEGEREPVGAVMREAFDAYNMGGSFELGMFLGYPLNRWHDQLIEDEFFQRELFAQLGRLYSTNPQLMQRELPIAYALYQQIDEHGWHAVATGRAGNLRGVQPQVRQERPDVGGPRPDARGGAEDRAGSPVERQAVGGRGERRGGDWRTNQRILLATAKQVEDQFPQGHPGRVPAESLQWRHVDRFPLANFGESELKSIRDDYPDERWVKAWAGDSIVVYHNPSDGNYYLWDGNHRIAAATRAGMRHLPAIVGVPKDAPQAVAEGLPPRDIDRARALGIPVTHGRIVGAPKGTPATVSAFLELADTLARRAGSKTAHPRDWHWYEDAAKVIREYAGPSNERREMLVRLIAKTSQRNAVEGNARSAVEAAISLARGDVGVQNSLMRPEQWGKQLSAIIAADTFDQSLDGVGPKVLNFYRNLHDEVFGRNEYPNAVTIDRHIGYLTGLGEKFSERQYDYAAALINEATRRHNRRTGENRKPREMQARLWGWQINREGLATARREGREFVPQPADAFEGTLRSMGHRVTAEAVPSTTLPEGLTITALPPEKKRAFTRRVFEVIEELEDRLGVAFAARREGSGGYAGQVAPNFIVDVLGSQFRREAPLDHSTATQVARALQYVLRQDAVPWFTARQDLVFQKDGGVQVNEGAMLGYRLDFERELTDADERAILNSLQGELGAEAGFTRDGASVYVTNFAGSDNQSFVDAVERASDNLSATLPHSRGHYGAEGHYEATDWKSDPEQEGLLRALLDSVAPARRSDLEEWLQNRREDIASLARAEAGRDRPRSAPREDRVAAPLASRAPEIPRNEANLNEDERAVEARFAAYLQENFEEAASRYREMFGNDLAPDNARELSEDYSASKEARSRYSRATHEPSSWFIKQLYERALAGKTPEGLRSVVIFTAGGTGAGKTGGARGLAESAELVYDSNMSSFQSARQKIDQALKAGREVHVVYVHRDPVDALVHGALPRAMLIGRSVPLEAHLDTHEGARKTLPKLMSLYLTDDRVAFTLVENSRGRGYPRLAASLANITRADYSNLKQRLLNALETEFQNGRISEAVYRGTLGEDARPGDLARGVLAPLGRAGEPQPQGNPGRDELPGVREARPGEPFVVYRVGTRDTLENSNGGNADSVARHLAGFDDAFAPSGSRIGDTLYAFEVTAEGFGDYQGARGREAVSGSVGRVVRGKEVAYSFPQSGFNARVIGRVPVADLRAELERRGVRDFDEAGTNLGAEVIRSTMQRAAPAASRGAGRGSARVARVRSVITDRFGAAALDSLERQGIIKVIPRFSDLPEGATAGMTSGEEAIYWNGTAYLVAENLSDARVAPVLFHEIGEHYGLERMLGRDAYLSVLDRVRELNAAGDARVSAVWNEIQSDPTYARLGEGSETFTKEVLARLGEDAAFRRQPLWQRILHLVRSFLRSIGIDKPLSADELVDLIEGSLKHTIRQSQNRFASGVMKPPVGGAAREQANSSEFKRWFGGSKVVDSEGRPLVVYHGTWGADFTEFNFSDERAQFYRTTRLMGAWFTPSAQLASHYGNDRRGGMVMPVYLSIKRPKEISSYDRRVLEEFTSERSARSFKKKLIAQGYDGIFVVNTNGDLEEIVAFRPEQIKSAIGNRGTFDQNDPSILRSSHAGYTRAFSNLMARVRQGGAAAKSASGHAVPVMETPRSLAEATHKGTRVLTPSHVIGYFGRIRGSGNALGIVPDAVLERLPELLERPRSLFLQKNGVVRVVLTEVVRGNPVVVVIDPRRTFGRARVNEIVDVELRSPKEISGWQRLGLQMKSAGHSEGAIPTGPARSAEADRGQTIPEEGSSVKEPLASRRVMPQWVASQPRAVQEALQKAGVIVQEQTFAERVAELKETFWKDMRQGVFDQYDPIRSLDYRAYMMARMAKSADQGLEALMMYGKPFLRDGALDVRYEGGLIKVLQRLQGEHDRFFSWIAGNRAQRLKQEGRENLFTNEDITALKDLDRGRMPDGRSRRELYQSVLQQFNAYSKAVLDIAQGAGLINAEDRATWEHDFYVPFYRVMEEGAAGPNVSKGLVNQYAFKRLKGGAENLNDLLANTLRNWSHLLSASLRNQAARATLEAAVGAGVAIEVPSREVGKEMRIGTDVLKVLDEGVERFFIVEDAFLLDAITSLEWNGFQGIAMKALQKFKHWLTFGVTVNPTFRIRNLMRDAVTAVAQNPLSYNPFKNIAQGWRATKHESGSRATMLASGAIFRFGTMLEGQRADHVRRLIDKGVDAASIIDNQSKLKAVLQQWWDTYQENGDRFENANRAALYEQLRAQGYDHLEASYGARDLLDFSMQGKWRAIRFLVQSVPFFNARLQGLYKLGRSAKEEPTRMGYVMGAVVMASLALMLYYQDDEDWKKREEWDRDNFWWFKVGDKAFRIPKPFEIGAIGSLAERSLEWMLSKEKGAGKRFARRLGALVADNLSMNPTPQLVKPVIDLYANKDSFTGRPIETMGMERLSKAERIGANTTVPAQLLGKLGLLSPAQVDHAVRAYFGWVGTAALTSIDYGMRPLTGRASRPSLQLREVFLAGNFVESLPSNGSRYVTAFYEQAKEIEQAYADYRNAVKLGDTKKAAEIVKEKGDKIAQRQMISNAKAQLTRLNENERRVEASTSISPETKRRLLDMFASQKNRLTEQVVR